MPQLEDAGPQTLFQSHFERIRRRLEAEGNAARSFHHGMNRGLIREAFIREFLTENISGFWGVGTGEIFHGEASEEEARNQIDVVIHNKRYPKLPLSAGIDLFLVETVSATIEIKSSLTKNDVRKAAAVAKRIKPSAFCTAAFQSYRHGENSTPLLLHLRIRGTCQDRDSSQVDDRRLD